MALDDPRYALASCDVDPQHYARELEYWDRRGSQDYVSLSSADQARISSWIGPIPGNMSCLDIGGGSGMIGRLLAEERGRFAVCLDISLEMLRHSPVHAVQGDALQLPFRDKSFDLIVAAAFLHHLPGRESAVFEECARVLRPGGRIVGYDPSLKCIQNRIFMGDGPLRLKFFSPDERPIDPAHLTSELQAAGFESIATHPFSFRNARITPFEAIQRWVLNPLSVGPLRLAFQRWFFWSGYRA
jgi:SAM-dependent methyltransferase